MADSASGTTCLKWTTIRDCKPSKQRLIMRSSDILLEWEKARDDLGIEVVIACELHLQDGQNVKAPVLVPNFGSKAGTVVFADDDSFWRYHHKLAADGYGSTVFDIADQRYNRSIFIDMLAEWGWCGNDVNKPWWLKR